MLEKFERPEYDKVYEKWFEKGENLTAEEISFLFGLVEAKKDRLEMIKNIVNAK